jgi:hypothetical protein
MAKGIHPSYDPMGIIADVINKGLKITMATPILSNKDKYPLVMFMLTFEHGEDIKNIFKIETIQGVRIKIENVRSKLIPQCRHCHGYGLTQKYCNLQPKCVKCAGDHNTKQCTKGDLRTAKCANCIKNRPANYRGCEIAKKKQKKNDILRNKATREAEQQQISQQQRRNLEIRTEIKEKKRVPQKDGHTYAQIARGNPRKETELPKKRHPTKNHREVRTRKRKQNN